MWLGNIIIYVIYDYDCNLQYEGVEKETGTVIFIVPLCLEHWPYSF